MAGDPKAKAKKTGTDCFAAPSDGCLMPMNLDQSSRVITANSMLQSTHLTPHKQAAIVDMLIRNGATDITVLAADFLQIPNVPHMLYLRRLEAITRPGRGVVQSAAEIEGSLLEAAQEFRENVLLVLRHLKGLQELAELSTEKTASGAPILTPDNILDVCREHNILLDGAPMVDFIKREGREWIESVRGELIKNFESEIVERFIKFRCWDSYYGNPSAPDEEGRPKREGFIRYLKYLKGVFDRFNNPEYAEYKANVTRYAGEVALTRYNPMMGYLKALKIRLAQLRHEEVPKTDTVPSLLSLSLKSVKEGVKSRSVKADFFEKRARLDELPVESWQASLKFLPFDIYPLGDAQDLCMGYLLGEFVIFNMLHRCKINYIVYPGGMTNAVKAHYDAWKYDGWLNRRRHSDSDSVSGERVASSPPLMEWLQVKLFDERGLDSSLLRSNKYGRSFRDEGLVQYLFSRGKEKGREDSSYETSVGGSSAVPITDTQSRRMLLDLLTKNPEAIEFILMGAEAGIRYAQMGAGFYPPGGARRFGVFGRGSESEPEPHAGFGRRVVGGGDGDRIPSPPLEEEVTPVGVAVSPGSAPAPAPLLLRKGGHGGE